MGALNWAEGLKEKKLCPPDNPFALAAGAFRRDSAKHRPLMNPGQIQSFQPEQHRSISEAVCFLPAGIPPVLEVLPPPRFILARQEPDLFFHFMASSQYHRRSSPCRGVC